LRLTGPRAIDRRMKDFISSLLLLSLLFLSACAAAPDRGDHIVRFALRPEQIESWEEKSGGIAVRLNTEGRRQLASLTRHNVGSEMQIYAGRVLLTSTTIGGVIRGDNIYVAIDNDDVHDLTLAQLPAAKKAS